MKRQLVGGGVLAAAGLFLLLAPLGLKPYGIFILSMWAVMTIAAIGLNLTLGYAGQISLAQAAFVGIGAYITAKHDAKPRKYVGQNGHAPFVVSHAVI